MRDPDEPDYPGEPDSELESIKTSFALKAEGLAKAQSQAIVDLTQNLRLILAEAIYAEYETKELCRELCLTAEFFNKILQSEKFENIPF